MATSTSSTAHFTAQTSTYTTSAPNSDSDSDSDLSQSSATSSRPRQHRSSKRPASKSNRGPVTRHEITLYDALADRAGPAGRIQGTRHKGLNQKPLPPDEVLGRRKNAPKEGIPFPSEEERRELPDGELLMAIHAYASEVYSREDFPEASYKSMDETALLAMGILIEEAIDTILGTQGHHSFCRAKETPLELKMRRRKERIQEEEERAWAEEERERAGAAEELAEGGEEGEKVAKKRRKKKVKEGRKKRRASVRKRADEEPGWEDEPE